MSTYGGGLGGGAESHGKAMPNGQHWGDRPVWSEADAKALEGFGRKPTKAGVGLDMLVTGYDLFNGAPAARHWRDSVVARLEASLAGLLQAGCGDRLWGPKARWLSGLRV
jgi:hypothetical protein